MSKVNIFKNPIHLGLGAKAVVEPEFTGEMGWYMGYGERHGSDGAGRAGRTGARTGTGARA